VAAVDVEVKPDSAEVYLDGVFVGKADDFDGYPGYLFLLPGKYKLELKHPLYTPVTVDLEVKKGRKVEVAREMALLPGKGKLDSFDPPDRGTPLGRVFGPGAVPVDPRGPRNRERPRFDPDQEGQYGVDAELDESAPAPRPVPKKPARPGIAWNVTPDDASVYLDDRFLGTAEELNAGRGTRIEPGRHTVTVVRPGFKTRAVDVDVKETGSLSVTVDLEK
jgi:hypothetical protein